MIEDKIHKIYDISPYISELNLKNQIKNDINK